MPNDEGRCSFNRIESETSVICVVTPACPIALWTARLSLRRLRHRGLCCCIWKLGQRRRAAHTNQFESDSYSKQTSPLPCAWASSGLPTPSRAQWPERVRASVRAEAKLRVHSGYSVVI